MYFHVTFSNEQRCSVEVSDNHVASVEADITIEDISLMIHDICDDLDMVRPQDMEKLQEAIDRFNYLTKVED